MGDSLRKPDHPGAPEPLTGARDGAGAQAGGAKSDGACEGLGQNSVAAPTHALSANLTCEGVGVPRQGAVDPYRFTVKPKALLVPAPFVTATFTSPYWARVGTLHLIRVALQEMYVAQVLPPNCTKPVPRVAPRLAPVMVTSAPRLPEAGLRRVMVGAAGVMVSILTVQVFSASRLPARSAER